MFRYSWNARSQFDSSRFPQISFLFSVNASTAFTYLVEIPWTSRGNMLARIRKNFLHSSFITNVIIEENCNAKRFVHSLTNHTYFLVSDCFLSRTSIVIPEKYEAEVYSPATVTFWPFHCEQTLVNNTILLSKAGTGLTARIEIQVEK